MLEAAKLEGHVDLLHEAVANDHPEEALAIIADLAALLVADIRDVLDPDGEQDDALVKHLVVLEVVEQRVRHAAGRAGHEDGGALHARGAGRGGLDENLHRQAGFVHPVDHQLAPARPGGKQDEDYGAGE